jgi:hypothetical protein
MSRALTVLALLAATFARSDDTPTPPLTPIDAPAIATRVVAALHPAEGEGAVLVSDPSYYPELTRAIELELDRAGVRPVITLNFPAPELVKKLYGDPARAKQLEEGWVRTLQPLFDQSALFFWLPARWVPPGHALEKLVGASRVRGIHFHWLLPLDGRTEDAIRIAGQTYERAILQTDYAALAAEQERLAAALKGRTLRVTTPTGTDLRMRLAPDAWFHKNDGDLSPAEAAAGRGARDREMEFPAGALRFIPEPASVQGQLVIPRLVDPRLMIAGGGVVENLVLEFTDGRAAVKGAAVNESGFRELFGRIGGDIDKVGEVVLGTSPLLGGKFPWGELPYFGYGAGHLRISLGDNWESGGPLRTPHGENLWLFLEGATLEADGTVLVSGGRLTR